jgi:dinuclear metal center YbgI/SA1388 family protein
MTSLKQAIEALESIAPLSLAASWDNTGLLLQSRALDTPASRILVTIDLTEAVIAEAIGQNVDLIMAYHPIIFAKLHRITRDEPQQRVLLDALANGISIHSLHTALDAIPGGVNDWLLGLLGACNEIQPIEAAPPLAWNGDGNAGQGRVATLAQPAPLIELIDRVKTGTNLKTLRVAASEGHGAGAMVTRVAVCPGAGGGLFETINDVDLLVTGEMRHHDILSRVARGTSVILTEHTNCERGYLPQFAEVLSARLGPDVSVAVSDADQDPLVML